MGDLLGYERRLAVGALPLAVEELAKHRVKRLLLRARLVLTLEVLKTPWGAVASGHGDVTHLALERHDEPADDAEHALLRVGPFRDGGKVAVALCPVRLCGKCHVCSAAGHGLRTENSVREVVERMKEGADMLLRSPDTEESLQRGSRNANRDAHGGAYCLRKLIHLVRALHLRANLPGRRDVRSLLGLWYGRSVWS
jgi:hypothetical protein